MARYDVHIELVNSLQSHRGKFYTFGFERTRSVRGIQKLVNLFAKHLLTPIGSDPIDRGYGTDFPNLLGSNVTPDDARDILVLAVDQVVKALQKTQPTETPDDERMGSASVTRYFAVPALSGLTAQIYVRNVANQGLTFLLPTLEVKR